MTKPVDGRSATSSTAVTWLWRVLAPLISILLIVVAVQDAGPAYRARFGSGVEGVFTVVRVEEGARGGDVYYGDFVPDDRSAVRKDVWLVEGGDVAAPGDSMRAVDTGNPRGIYPADGSTDWILLTVLGSAAVVVLGAWVITMVRSCWRKRVAGRERH